MAWLPNGWLCAPPTRPREIEDETEEYVESTEISPEERAVEPPERALCRALNGPVSRWRQPRWLLGTAPSLVVDWERACGSIRSLLDGFSAIDGTEERSASYCARVGTECERSGSKGPTSDDLLIAADEL
jgi:hypothetical protein